MNPRALLASVLLGAVLVLPFVALADWPARPRTLGLTACSRQVVDYVAYVPVALQARIADAGYGMSVTPGNPYKQLRGRAWVCSRPDGGSVTVIPPKLARLAEYFRPDLTSTVDATCADPTFCPASGDDGTDDGTDNPDPVTEQPLPCACSNGVVLADGGATCRYASTGGYDAGNAPTGLTLQPGTFQGPGCKNKSCAELWQTQTLSDGGVQRLDSFPPACPVP